jgi:hypothetical protein
LFHLRPQIDLVLSAAKSALGTSRLSKDVRIHGEYWNVTGLTRDIANSALMTRTRLV